MVCLRIAAHAASTYAHMPFLPSTSDIFSYLSSKTWESADDERFLRESPCNESVARNFSFTNAALYPLGCVVATHPVKRVAMGRWQGE